MNTHYCLELHKTRTMNLILSHFSGYWDTKTNAVKHLIYSKNCWECPALERSKHCHDPLHLNDWNHSDSSPSYSGTTVHYSRSFQRFAEDRHHTLVVGLFRHLLQFLVLLLLSGHLHPAIINIRLEYSG